jgi:hypothetical protein
MKMKLTALALAAILGVTSFAAVPALAGDSKDFDAAYYVTQLNYDGVNAVDVEDAANGTMKATVKLADGSTAFRYFDKATFEPVAGSLGV